MKNITITIIFEGSALNRDENIGGNILSIKKINVNDELKSFISKVAMRHYLFETLQKAFPEDWKCANVRLAKNDVVQFDIQKFNILNCGELDLFGFMFTIGNQAITRKSPLGITKAISLTNYNQDMAFYSNHDLINRGKIQGIESINPDLYSKEEHISLYKCTFTLDMDNFGKEIIIADKYESRSKSIIVKYKEDNNEKDFKMELGAKPQLKSKINGTEKYLFELKVDDNIKKRRAKEVLTSIKNGLYAQSSGESNTITPLFIISSGVSIPSPIFHPFIDILKKDNNYFVVGIDDCKDNCWINSKIYVQNCNKLKSNFDYNEEKFTNDWNEFLKEVEILDEVNDKKN